ncbi:hypothetical protein PMAYCL1PPCAC_23125, partial [Pristionchus mayeri]
LRFTLLASIFYTTWALCPIEFELVRNGECYTRLYEEQQTYSPSGAVQAIKNCASFSLSIPVSIKNQQDHDYWVSVAREDKKKGPDYGNIVLGIYCDGTNHWKWADGRDVYYEWKPSGYDIDLNQRCGESGLYCMWTVDPETNNWKKWCNEYLNTSLYCEIPYVKPEEPDRDCATFSPESDDYVCYQVGLMAANWTEANNICHVYGASVASIHNDRENTFLRRLAVSKGLVNGVLLGGMGNANHFRWADGSPWDYSNFATVAGLGDCLAMDTSTTSGTWVNVDCSSDISFSCARPWYTTAPACDGGVHHEGEIMYSPGFPYSASEPCDFMLIADPGKLVEVEILLLEANACCDHLEIFEGTLGGNLIADLTGAHQNGIKFRTTSQNAMRVSWRPQGGVNVKGMMITFRGV